MPLECVDVIGRTRIALERFGRAERRNGGGDIVMPRAGIGVHLFIRESVIFADFEPFIGAEKWNAVDPPASCGNMFFKAPAQAAVEIELPFFGVVVVGRIRPCQTVVTSLV